MQFFSSRIQIHDFFIYKYDLVDFRFEVKQLSLKKVKVIHLETTFSYTTEYLTTLYLTKLLQLEWNSNQRFSRELTLPQNNLLTAPKNFRLCLRKHSLFLFLDNCLNSIFLSKKIKPTKTNNSYTIEISKSETWQYFNCHFILSNLILKSALKDYSSTQLKLDEQPVLKLTSIFFISY